MAIFRKKPLMVEAWRYDPDWRDAPAWVDEAKAKQEGADGSIRQGVVSGNLYVFTLSGKVPLQPGDWLIKGVAGELYPCKDEIFRELYEAVDDPDRWEFSCTKCGAKNCTNPDCDACEVARPRLAESLGEGGEGS